MYNVATAHVGLDHTVDGRLSTDESLDHHVFDIVPHRLRVYALSLQVAPQRLQAPVQIIGKKLELNRASEMIWYFSSLPYRYSSRGVVSWTCDPVLALGQRLDSYSRPLFCCNPLG